MRSAFACCFASKAVDVVGDAAVELGSRAEVTTSLECCFSPFKCVVETEAVVSPSAGKSDSDNAGEGTAEVDADTSFFYDERCIDGTKRIKKREGRESKKGGRMRQIERGWDRNI